MFISIEQTIFDTNPILEDNLHFIDKNVIGSKVLRQIQVERIWFTIGVTMIDFLRYNLAFDKTKSA